VIIQLVLSAGLAFALLYAYLQRRKSRAVSLGIMLVSAAGILAVLAPGASTAVAQAVGVGRGADLVVYCWIVITLLVSVNLQFKILRLQNNLTVLTREVALRSPLAAGCLPDSGGAGRTGDPTEKQPGAWPGR
jgi:hypothetical protein